MTTDTFPWPEPGAPGDVISTTAHRVFLIESVWAYPNEPLNGLRWSSYYASAYRDRDTGKLFIHAHPDLAQHPDRVDWGSGTRSDRTYHESWAFRTLEAATACMARLREHAECASDYEGNEHWRVPRRGRPIKFRIVEINHANTITVAAS